MTESKSNARKKTKSENKKYPIIDLYDPHFPILINYEYENNKAHKVFCSNYSPHFDKANSKYL